MRIRLGESKWSVAPSQTTGCSLLFLDEQSNVEVEIPIGNAALSPIIRAIVERGDLNEEQKRELAPLFNGGLFLPGEDYRPGPQG